MCKLPIWHQTLSSCLVLNPICVTQACSDAMTSKYLAEAAVILHAWVARCTHLDIELTARNNLSHHHRDAFLRAVAGGMSIQIFICARCGCSLVYWLIILPNLFNIQGCTKQCKQCFDVSLLAMTGPNLSWDCPVSEDMGAHSCGNP